MKSPSKTILCFGDSLTWGFVPGADRLPFDARWPGVVQAELGPGVRVIEEALNGRTTVFDDAYAPNRSGKALLPTLLECHSPLDVVILMLGTNDLQPYRKLTAAEVARGCAVLVDLIRQGPPGGQSPVPEVLLVAPPPMGTVRGLMAYVFAGGEEASRGLAGAYQVVAEDRKCHFFDAGSAVRVGAADGVHLDEAGQRALGVALASVVRETLGVLG